jgi:hypothetical protein
MHKLREKYSEFFPEYGKGYCGFETDAGWDDLLDELFSALREEVANGAKPLQFLQIKEKFGGLRAYFKDGTERMSNLIRVAEQEAAKTCELCGEEGKLCIRNGWYKTLCPPHAKENEYE